MSQERLFLLKNRWFTTALGLTAGFAAAAAIAGLILLPYAQTDLKPISIWDAICNAAGVPQMSPAVATVPATFKTSVVPMSSGMLMNPTAVSIGRGATLALQCAICHGADSVNLSNFPYLAGQRSEVIYKQLHDFQSGARVSAVMGPFAVALSEQNMIDLAAYYAYLPRVPAYHSGIPVLPPKVVVNGAPMRNIPPCGACHGGGNKLGSPRLEGLSAVYIKAQLQAFAGGTRRNDISEQMRNVARHMTAPEIAQAADFYADTR